MPSDRERILTDEEVLERLESVHRVARADPDDALVGLDPDDRHCERDSGTGSHAAGKGGSRGTRRRWRRMAPILTAPVSPTYPGRRFIPRAIRAVSGGKRYPDRPHRRREPVTTALDRPPEEAAEDTSFARGLRVFLTIADRGEIRADELSTLLDTPLSTIYRYLRTLTEFGFVERQGSGYRLGSRLHVLGAGPAVSAEELIRAADPVLIGLTEATGETAFISRRIGRRRGVARAGPLAATRCASRCEPGQAGAARMSARSARSCSPSRRPRSRRRRSPRSRVGRRPGGAGARGDEAIATDAGDTFAGVTTVAVPIMRADGIVAAISVAAPAERAGRRWLARTRGALRRAASEIEASLGAPTGDSSRPPVLIVMWHQDFPRFDNRAHEVDAARHGRVRGARAGLRGVRVSACRRGIRLV